MPADTYTRAKTLAALGRLGEKYVQGVAGAAEADFDQAQLAAGEAADDSLVVSLGAGKLLDFCTGSPSESSERPFLSAG